jgi:two-component system, response regulator YesN
MIRAVIVEDEMLVRLGLKMCLEADPEFFVTGTFASAEEAESSFDEHTADVLITDVRLPGITGLELIHRLRARFPSMVMIVLSCYEDFSYARTALEYGANRYILKHELDEKELPKIVSELVNGAKLPAQKQTGELDIRQYAREHGTEGLRAAYFAFRGRGDFADATGDDMNLELVCGILRTVLKDYQLGNSFIYRESGIAALLCCAPGFTRQESENRLAACFREISQSLQLYIDKNCYAGVSDVFSKPEQLTEKITEAADRCRLSFFYEESRLFTGRELRGKTCPPLEFIREDSFTPEWREKTHLAMAAFFEACQREKPPIDRIGESVMRFLQAMLSHGEQFYGLDRRKAYGEDEEPSYRTVSQFDSLAAMQSWLAHILDRTIRYVGNQQNLTQKIRAYLTEHYAEELVQSDVASIFHMSGPYFSQYFKQNLGVNYVQYLNTLRIEQAKLLLQTTNNSTESIGALVGIPNVSYFFRLFKKTEGCTVKEYRRRSRGNC